MSHYCTPSYCIPLTSRTLLWHFRAPVHNGILSCFFQGFYILTTGTHSGADLPHDYQTVVKTTNYRDCDSAAAKLKLVLRDRPTICHGA
jgi:hypothetical protein